VRSQH
jgi:hypothetical protein